MYHKTQIIHKYLIHLIFPVPVMALKILMLMQSLPLVAKNTIATALMLRWPSYTPFFTVFDVLWM